MFAEGRETIVLVACLALFKQWFVEGSIGKYMSKKNYKQLAINILLYILIYYIMYHNKLILLCLLECTLNKLDRNALCQFN